MREVRKGKNYSKLFIFYLHRNTIIANLQYYVSVMIFIDDDLSLFFFSSSFVGYRNTNICKMQILKYCGSFNLLQTTHRGKIS